MGYYDDDEYEDYYEYTDRVEPSFITEGFSERLLSNSLAQAGLIPDSKPRYVGNMEKIVFMYGDSNEVYSPAEIRFTEHIDKVYIYQDFSKNLSKGSMPCRTIATVFDCDGSDALKACICFEKIIDKALDGFNIFFFVTEDSIFFGCRRFDSEGLKDCVLSNPIKSESAFSQMLDELGCMTYTDDFMEFYTHIKYAFRSASNYDQDYEELVFRRRGMQMSYLEDISSLEKELGISCRGEKRRYWQMFNSEPQYTFEQLLEDAEDSLAFIKSNRVNTYELLFEADEMMRQAEAVETENAKLAEEAPPVQHEEDAEADEEAKALLDDPEEMIKLLKKWRGI